MDNLTRDSIEAKNLGISYGQLIAQKGTHPEPRKKIEPITGQGKRTHCAVCGEPIRPGGKRKYCSDACQREYYNRKNRERMRRLRSCDQSVWV